MKYLILLVLLLGGCITPNPNQTCYNVNPLGDIDDYFCCCEKIKRQETPIRDRADRWKHK